MSDVTSDSHVAKRRKLDSNANEPQSTTSSARSFFDKTYRVQGIPIHYDGEQLKTALLSLLDLSETLGFIKVRSLSTCLAANRQHRVATVSFKETPRGLREGREWPFELLDTETSTSSYQIVIDSHFKGLTPLGFLENESKQAIDCIVIPGLGGHAFGSFKERGGEYMWLGDSLSQDIPTFRVMTYGYDSVLAGSQSFQNIETLATGLRAQIMAMRSGANRDNSIRPIIFIAHSLGGLLVKEALIQMHEEKSLDKSILRSIYGAIFFGVPNQGLNISSLRAMVEDQSNRYFLESLGLESDLLKKQQRKFPEAFGFKDSEIYCFYETLESNTAIQIDGKWAMKGKPTVLLNSRSATHVRPWENDLDHAQPIDKNHSNLVKFSRYDADYDKVAYILRGFADRAVNVIQARFRLNAVATSVSNDTTSSFTAEVEHALIKSLSFKRIDARLLNIKSAFRRTCAWVFSKREYSEWIERKGIENHNFLWIKGKPGSGKSTIMKQVLRRTEKTLRDALVVSYFFNARGTDMLEKTTLGMYRSLCHQILEKIPSLQDLFVKSFSSKIRHDDSDPEWTVQELQNFLSENIGELQKTAVVIFIDALDECEENDVRDLVEFLEDLDQTATSSKVSLNVCLSSRHYPHITVKRATSLVVEDQKGHDNDIIMYVNNKLKGDDEKQQVIDLKAEVCRKSSGVFLWVVLVVQLLNEAFDHGEIDAMRDRLDEIPPELHNLFKDILTRDSKDKDSVVLILQWMLFAQRSLSSKELYFAIKSGSESSILKRSIENPIELEAIERYILSCSKGLLEISASQDKPVQFIHETVRDFLLKDEGLANIQADPSKNFVGTSHARLANCCLQYYFSVINSLPSAGVELGAPKRGRVFGFKGIAEITEKLPFLHYAITNIFYHTGTAEREGVFEQTVIKMIKFPNVVDIMLEYRDEYPPARLSKLPLWITLHNSFVKHKVRQNQINLNLLYLASEQGLSCTVRYLLHHKLFNVQAYGGRYGTPLQAACVNGYLETVSVLIEFGANVNEHFGEFGTALVAAVEKNNIVIAKYLIDAQANIESRVQNCRSILTIAARNGSREMLKLLLDNGANIEAVDKDLNTPLLWAVKCGHRDAIKLLFDYGANIEAVGKDSDTPLLWAAKYGHRDAIKLLLDYGANIEVVDKVGSTPFYRAVKYENFDVAKTLLEAGASIKSKDDDILLRAVQSSNPLDLCKLLLEKGANVEGAKGFYKRTPLFWACVEEKLDVIQLLLQYGADVDARDKSGETPLSWILCTSGEFRFEMAQLLVQYGANIEAIHKETKHTPLSIALNQGYDDILELFYKHRAIKGTENDPILIS